MACCDVFTPVNACLLYTSPARTICEACGEVYPTVQYGRQCPACKSEQTHLVQGNEMMIQEIEVDPESEAVPVADEWEKG